LDYFPTLISLAGLSFSGNLDGADLSPELLGGEAIVRDAVLLSNFTAHWDYFKTCSDAGVAWAEWCGVKTQQYTYVRWLSGEIELYDDQDDPDQLTNLSEATHYAPVVKALEARLVALLAEAHDEFPPGNAYVKWVDNERNIIRTGLGLIQ